ncbi:phosphate acetyltransferase [bacterium]|nr:phosphate acetyltransferase [bacterium]
MTTFLEQLEARVRNLSGQVRVLFPESGDRRVMDAAQRLKREGLGDPIMVNAEGEAAEGLTHVAIDGAKADELAKLLVELRGHKGMTEDEAKRLSRDPLIYGMYLLRIGEADALVAGAVRTTSDVLRAGLWLVEKEEGIKTISSSFYMLVPPFRGGFEEVITFADCGVVETPTSEQLADIAIAAADARTFIVGDEPRLAFLSFSTKGSGGTSESVARVRDAIGLVQKRRPDILLAEHELQGDAALVASVAERKVPGSAVAGTANVLIFPSLDAANIAYKLVERLVPGAQALGPIVHGFKSPVHDLSRGASSDDIFRSALIAVIRAKKNQT